MVMAVMPTKSALGTPDADGIAQVFLDDGDVVLGRRDRRQQLKRGALDLSPTQPERRVRIRIDELDSHSAYTLLAGDGRRWNVPPPIPPLHK
jgi:hypothetical protein